MTDGRGGGTGCLNVHWGKWKQLEDSWVLSLIILGNTKPLDVRGSEAEEDNLRVDWLDEVAGLPWLVEDMLKH